MNIPVRANVLKTQKRSRETQSVKLLVCQQSFKHAIMPIGLQSSGKPSRGSKRELDRIAEGATTDCYDEYEQIAGWCAYLEDVIDRPCSGSCLLANVRVHENEYKVAAETVAILDKKYSKYLEAYKEWL